MLTTKQTQKPSSYYHTLRDMTNLPFCITNTSSFLLCPIISFITSLLQSCISTVTMNFHQQKEKQMKATETTCIADMLFTPKKNNKLHFLAFQ
jgi:hypothetical protein